MSEDATPAIDPPRPRRRRRFVIWGLVVGALVVVGWLALRAGGDRERGRARPPPAPVSVVTATVTRGDLPVYLDAIGTVTAIATVSLTSQVTGVIQAVHYQEGQLVRRGERLVDIDRRPFEATLRQAQGTLERDLHALAQARMDRDRYRAAWARRAIAKQQLDDQEKLVLQAEATVELDRGAVDFDRVQLSYTRITAPITGRVGLRLVDPGNVVVANSTTVLVVIAQMRPISVVFPLSEDHLSDVRAQPDHGAGLRVDVFDRVKARRLATGRLATIDNQIDTATGTVRLRALFDNPGEELFPNQFVNARLLVTTVRDAAVLPSSAVQRNGAQTFVYAIVDGRAHVTPVTVGVVSGDRTQVTGVAPGAVVANSSFEKLRDGAPVVAAPAPPPATEPQVQAQR